MTFTFNKLTKKSVKEFKAEIADQILNRMNSQVGYVSHIWNPITEEPDILIVNDQTQGIPDYWQAGISNSLVMVFGQDITRENFAKEEALRKMRDLFSDQADFITWAWYSN